jgi:hypothetical protein
MVMAMAEKRHADVKRSEPQAERRGWRRGKRNQRQYCNCEISADLFHDPAPEAREI